MLDIDDDSGDQACGGERVCHPNVQVSRLSTPGRWGTETRQVADIAFSTSRSEANRLPSMRRFG